LPSASESFGLAALEALACGVPVVASAVGGIPEVIRHDQTGILCPVGDTQAMAAAVARLTDPATHQAFAQAARAEVVARFEVGPAVLAYEQIYRATVGR
jgi:L-malate glycosyltransferase